MNANAISKQDVANRRAEGMLAMKRARSTGTSELFAYAQEMSARVLTEESTRGEIAHTLYIASVQEEPFREVNEIEEGE